MRITRLAEGVDERGALASAAINRTLKVLTEFRTVMDAHGVGASRLVATSAARDAANRDEFLSAAGTTSGVEAELLSGEEEGRLSYLGATLGLSGADGDDVVVDVGGGSTELVLKHLGAMHVVSLELGCVRLSERFLRHDPPTAHELEGAVKAIDEELRRAVVALPFLGEPARRRRLIGLAGTVSTLAMLDQGLVTYERERVHHYRLGREAVERWSAILSAEPAQRRGARTGMVAGREDVIVGGALVLREVVRRLGVSEVLVSESDILDGIVADLLAAFRS